MLVILGGRSGVGKTTISRELARQLRAVLIRIDSIEQAIHAAGVPVDEIGYRVGYAMAADNLRLGLPVIADSVNPWPITREAWRAVAGRVGSKFVEVEIVCGDREEHRRRVESRTSDIEGLHLPTWGDVVERSYTAWTNPDLVVDTALLSVEDAVSRIREAVALRA